jgi:hypothetical protein
MIGAFIGDFKFGEGKLGRFYSDSFDPLTYLVREFHYEGLGPTSNFTPWLNHLPLVVMEFATNSYPVDVVKESIYVLHCTFFGRNQSLYFRKGMLGFFGIQQKITDEGELIDVDESEFPESFLTLHNGLVSTRPGHFLDAQYYLHSFQICLLELIQSELKATRGFKNFNLKLRVESQHFLALQAAAIKGSVILKGDSFIYSNSTHHLLQTFNH